MQSTGVETRERRESEYKQKFQYVLFKKVLCDKMFNVFSFSFDSRMDIDVRGSYIHQTPLQYIEHEIVPRLTSLLTAQ